MDIIQVNIHEAQTQLSKLIEAALKGKQVIIAENHCCPVNFFRNAITI